jgi:hypothetical protein
MGQFLRDGARSQASATGIPDGHDVEPLMESALRWDMVDLARGLLHVRCAKNGTPSVRQIELHPLRDWEEIEVGCRS